MSDQHIVIDNGSGVIKAGFSGKNHPEVKFPSIVGRPTHNAMIGGDNKSEYIGDEAQKLKGVLKITYPIESGIVLNWEDMEKVWDYCFANELRVDPQEHKVLLTEAPGNPKANREKMAQVMFETFQVAGLYIAIQAVLSLYSNGRTTGLVVDAGDGVTHTVPVYEGFSLPHAIFKNTVAGRVITEYMVKLLNLDGITNPEGGKGSWFQIIRDMKEETCFVSLTPAEDKQKAAESTELQTSYELPDGQVVNVNTPRFMAPEGLFEPAAIKEGSEVPGMHTLAHQSYMESDIDIRAELINNVILSGGSTMYKGLPDRLEKELDALMPKRDMVKIIAGPDRYYSVWCGGSTLVSLQTFESQWITKDEYEENGASVVHIRCV